MCSPLSITSMANATSANVWRGLARATHACSVAIDIG